MKKYLTSFLILCLLFYFTGCFSMQEVGKDELSSKKSPAMYLWTKDKEFKFDSYNYSIKNDTIQGKGKYTYTGKDTAWIPFDGKIALNDAKKIQLDKLNVFVFILLTTVISAVCIEGIILAGALWSGPFH